MMDNKLSKVIGERINTLLGVQHKKQKELANYLGVTDNTISYFCSGKRTPNTAQIGRIADFFNVSADYLLGRSDAWTIDNELKFVCEYTGLSEEAVQSLCSIHSELHELREQQNYFGDIPSEFVNVFISGGTLHVLSLYATQFLIAIMEQIESHRLAIDILKTDCADKKEKLRLIDSNLNEALDRQDLTLFRIQKTVLDYFESFMGDYEPIEELKRLREQYKTQKKIEVNKYGDNQKTK